MATKRTYQFILVEEASGIATITLDRPDRLNALSVELLEELRDALDELSRSGTARVLVITGAGRAFSSGADLSGEAMASRTSDLGDLLSVHFNPLIERIFSLPIPVITAVNGAAAGGGCSLALVGDLVIASDTAYFLQAFVHLGLVPDVGSTWLLPRLIGRANAMAMMMLGERISAPKACDWGMIYKVVEEAALMPTAHALAQRLAEGPTRAYALIRQGVRAAMETNLSEALRIESENQRRAAATEDFAEGVSAFLEKRAPKFRGR